MLFVVPCAANTINVTFFFVSGAENTENAENAKNDLIRFERCMNYSIDLTADAFGQCKCGQPKSAHINTSIHKRKVYVNKMD
mgnify:CR=1 FL=1